MLVVVVWYMCCRYKIMRSKNPRKVKRAGFIGIMHSKFAWYPWNKTTSKIPVFLVLSKKSAPPPPFCWVNFTAHAHRFFCGVLLHC